MGVSANTETRAEDSHKEFADPGRAESTGAKEAGHRGQQEVRQKRATQPAQEGGSGGLQAKSWPVPGFLRHRSGPQTEARTPEIRRSCRGNTRHEKSEKMVVG